MPTYEVRGFTRLVPLFKERNWPQPLYYECNEPLTANQLREKLDIKPEDVEAAFINRTIMPLSTKLQDGDRVSFVPPGVPTIHRFNLGFYDVKE